MAGLDRSRASDFIGMLQQLGNKVPFPIHIFSYPLLGSSTEQGCQHSNPNTRLQTTHKQATPHSRLSLHSLSVLLPTQPPTRTACYFVATQNSGARPVTEDPVQLCSEVIKTCQMASEALLLSERDTPIRWEPAHRHHPSIPTRSCASITLVFV